MDIQSFLKAKKVFNELEELDSLMKVLENLRDLHNNKDDLHLMKGLLDSDSITYEMKRLVAQKGLDGLDSYLSDKYKRLEKVFQEL